MASHITGEQDTMTSHVTGKEDARASYDLVTYRKYSILSC